MINTYLCSIGRSTVECSEASLPQRPLVLIECSPRFTRGTRIERTRYIRRPNVPRRGVRDVNRSKRKPYNLKMPYLKREGRTRCYYEVHGDGTPLLLTHGYSSASGMWHGQIEPFTKAGYKLIIWDMRGHGRSSYPDDQNAYSEAILSPTWPLFSTKSAVREVRELSVV